MPALESQPGLGAAVTQQGRFAASCGGHPLGFTESSYADQGMISTGRTNDSSAPSCGHYVVLLAQSCRIESAFWHAGNLVESP